MPRPKRDTYKFQISLANAVVEALDEDCAIFGLARSAYIAQLIMEKHIQLASTKLMKTMTQEQIQIALAEQLGGKIP